METLLLNYYEKDNLSKVFKDACTANPSKNEAYSEVGEVDCHHKPCRDSVEEPAIRTGFKP